MQTEPKNINVLSLAYLGDAVWEQFVRERVVLMLHDSNHADYLHKVGVKYVNAKSQSYVIKTMIEKEFLTEEEIALAKRARNHKIATKAKNADAITYKWATAFETIIGSLFLQRENERLSEIMNKAAELIESRKTPSHSAEQSEKKKTQTSSSEETR